MSNSHFWYVVVAQVVRYWVSFPAVLLAVIFCIVSTLLVPHLWRVASIWLGVFFFLVWRLFWAFAHLVQVDTWWFAACISAISEGVSVSLLDDGGFCLFRDLLVRSSLRCSDLWE